MGQMDKKSLLERIKNQGLLLDGPYGTWLESQRERLPPFHCPEELVLHHGPLVEEAHRQYLEAGAEAVKTCTFGATPHKLGLHGLQDRAREINFQAAMLARHAALDFPGTPVIGNLGPTGLLSIEQRTGYPDFYRNIHLQAEALLLGGVDLLLVETMNDMVETRAAIHACRDAMRRTGRDVPLAVSFSIDSAGRILVGTTIEAAARTVDHLRVDIIGLNCSMGPDEMESIARQLPAMVSALLLSLPNRGLPENRGGTACYSMPPVEFAAKVARFREAGYHLVGGCCGTTPSCVREMRNRLPALPPPDRNRPAVPVPSLTGIFDAFPLASSSRPVLVGERLNIHGSRKFKTAVEGGDWNAIGALARQQVDQGALVLDVCLATRDRQQQLELIRKIYPDLGVNAARPLMVDTTEPEAMEEACQRIYGRGLINSCNLEDPGLCRSILALARRHGQMVVCLPLEGREIPREPARRLELCRRILELAMEEGLAPEDLVFDPLILTLATGQASDRDNGRTALETLELIKAGLPGCFTIMGVSNISYGLPKAFRPVLNNVLLHHAAVRGLDFAIFNPAERMEPGALDPAARELAEDLLFGRREDALDRVLAWQASPDAAPATAAMEPDLAAGPVERLRKMIVGRRRAGFTGLLEATAREMEPAGLITEVFLAAMTEVGQGMEEKSLPLPYVLESAGMVQEGLALLREKFAVESGPAKGRIVLATVRGDVHDIGKNLVRLLLTHNGFEVIDLGVDVPAERIVEEIGRSGAHLAGLSALLVSTSREMGRVVELLAQTDHPVPVLIGGAAASASFAEELARRKPAPYPGGVYYGKDAGQGVRLAAMLMDPERRPELPPGIHPIEAVNPASSALADDASGPAVLPRCSSPAGEGWTRCFCVPPPVLLQQFNFEHRCGRKLLARGRAEDGFYRNLLRTGEELLQLLQDRLVLEPMAVMGVVPVCPAGEGAALPVSGRPVPLSLMPAARSRLIRLEGEPVLPLLVVTAGHLINEMVRHRFNEGDYLQGYILSFIGAELADDLADLTAGLLREALGLDRAATVRYSPGYPVWPQLADQQTIFQLLDVERQLGVKLSSGLQMIPEFSVSAGLFGRTGE